MTSFKDYLNIASKGSDLTEEEMFAAISLMMSGAADEAEMESFLRALSARGETAAEITGAARALRSKAAMIKAPEGAIDCCGTGGDGMQTYNISTAVALVLAGAGVPVAKHGNRAASSKSGAADVLEALGVPLDAPPEKLEKALNDLGFCFLMAPRHHEAMKHVSAVRKKIASRTIFNLLGPLANPAGTKRQIIGVFDKKWLVPMAETLRALGTEKAWIVHGKDGLDEITTTDETQIAILEGGQIETRTITPEDIGLRRVIPESLKGGDAKANAKALSELLDGAPGAYRDIVLANGAAALIVAGKTGDLIEAVQMAANSIDTKSAKNILNQYIKEIF